MRTFVAVCACLAVVAGAVRAQDPQILVETYTANFRQAATPETRLGVVRDAVSLRVPGLGPFYHTVVNRVLIDSAGLASDSRLQEMALLAVAAIGTESYTPALASVWELCRGTTVPEIRIAAFATLARIGAGDPRTAAEMSALLDAQNRSLSSGRRADTQLVLSLVRTLGQLGDAVALRPLFTARSLPYPASVTAAADQALLSLRGDLRGALVQIIESGSLREKQAALALGLRAPALDAAGRAVVAAAALKAALTAGGDAEAQALARDMRAASSGALAREGWLQGVELGLEHFGKAVAEFGRGAVDRSYLIEAIRALGTAHRREAAERLALHLELINSYTEHNQPYDEQVLLAVIETLGRLGDPIAFGNLSYAKYMPYSERVQSAVRQAIAGLKW